MTDFEALRTAVIKGKRNDVTAIVQEAINRGEDINSLLKQFSQTQEMMQKMTKRGGMRGMRFPF